MPNHIPGVWRAPGALRSAGLLQRISAIDAGDLQVPNYCFSVDASTSFFNEKTLSVYSEQIADKMGELLDEKQFILVLGGDCSISLGTGLALRRRGRYGLFFIDGHTDYSIPKRPITRAAAGTDLGLILGDGPDGLSNIDGLRPYFQAENVVAFGYRDGVDTAEVSYQAFRESACLHYPFKQITKTKALSAAQSAYQELIQQPIEGIWLHVDIDVLDPAFMPAVDSPDPEGGLKWNELRDILRFLLQQSDVMGMQLTIYDPERDPDGEYARRIVDMLSEVLSVRTTRTPSMQAHE